MKYIKVGFAFSASFCTFDKMYPVLEKTVERYDEVLPIFSENSAHTDTRFGKAEAFTAKVEQICGKKAMKTIPEVEAIGPQKLVDVLVVAPCTGNTLAKLAGGVTDTSVTMAAKAHLRNGRPLVLAISTNDGLSGNAKNIGELLCRKNIYFVPFRQDDTEGKPTSLVADMSKIPETIDAALEGRQLQPVLSKN
ncbi:MAG: dipicolinate synthase subunit B [Oscillospiraceae bacterium]|nr:dipicolinate synthase subunit B [Oscillospiraceae bacterium]